MSMRAHFKWLAAFVTFAVLIVFPDLSRGALTGHWKLDEGSGTTANDSVAGGTAGTIEGATWVNDPTHGWVLSFDGTDDRVHVNSSIYMFDAPFSMAAWIKTPSDFGAILYKADGEADWEAGEKMWHLIDAGDWGNGQPGSVSLEGWGCSATAGGDVDDDQWHHVALTWDAAPGTVYVDGTAVTLQDDRYNGSAQADRPADMLYIGWGFDDDGGHEWLTGLISDVRFYDHVLTAQEVADLATIGPPTPPTVANTPLGTDFTSGPVTVDPGVTVTAGTNPNITSATVTISPLPDAPNEVLTVGAPGSLAVDYNTTFGILTLTGTATAATCQTALRSVQYDNTATTPTAGIRTIEFLVQDAGGLLSDPSSKGLSVGGVSLGVRNWSLYK